MKLPFINSFKIGHMEFGGNHKVDRKTTESSEKSGSLDNNKEVFEKQQESMFSNFSYGPGGPVGFGLPGVGPGISLPLTNVTHFAYQGPGLDSKIYMGQSIPPARGIPEVDLRGPFKNSEVFTSSPDEINIPSGKGEVFIPSTTEFPNTGIKEMPDKLLGFESDGKTYIQGNSSIPKNITMFE